MTDNLKGQEEIRHFYGALAQYYDRVYHYIDYSAQVEVFASILRERGASGGREVLDLCCGTGRHAKLMRAAGFEVVGYDISANMLRVAKAEVPGLKLIRGDMTAIAIRHRFDLVLCYFNSIMYSRPGPTFLSTLQQVFGLLKPGGLFIFNFTDKAAGIDSVREHYEYSSSDFAITFEPKWIYGGTGDVMDLSVAFEVRECGQSRHFIDRHVMVALSIPEVGQLLTRSGFTVSIHDRQLTPLKPWDPTDTKALFVAQRPIAGN